MKNFFSVLLSTFAIFLFVAPASAETFDVPSTARITGTVNKDGSYTVSWTGVALDQIEHYHGDKASGWKTPMHLKGANQVHFRKGNPRFNGTNKAGLWMSWDCPAQTAKGVLAKDRRLVGIGIACDWVDPTDGQPKGALEIIRK